MMEEKGEGGRRGSGAVDPQQPITGWGRGGELSLMARTAVCEMFPSEDPVSQINFDPVDFLNQQFPDEASLAALDDFIRKASAHAKTLDEDLRDSVHNSSVEINSESVSFAVEQAFSAVKELHEKISSVKAKVLESEELVREICMDIQRLDVGKKNLSASFDILKRLHMLIISIGQLENAAKTRDYVGTAGLVETIDDLIHNVFKPYLDIRQLSELNRRIIFSKDILEKAIIEDYRVVGTSRVEIATDEMKKLAAGCDVLEVLGEDTVKKLADWIVTQQLQEYVKEFTPKPEVDYISPDSPLGLGNLEKRFQWLKKTAAQFVQTYGAILPKDWNVPGKICIDFCLMSRRIIFQFEF
jgi:hypothetical protein